MSFYFSLCKKVGFNFGTIQPIISEVNSLGFLYSSKITTNLSYCFIQKIRVFRADNFHFCVFFKACNQICATHELVVSKLNHSHRTFFEMCKQLQINYMQASRYSQKCFKLKSLEVSNLVCCLKSQASLKSVANSMIYYLDLDYTFQRILTVLHGHLISSELDIFKCMENEALSILHTRWSLI